MNSSASKGVTEADRGDSPLVTLLKVVYRHYAAVPWLHNQVNTCICARVNHGWVVQRLLKLSQGTA